MIEAKDKEQLAKLLASMDLAVPPRSEGRTKQHTERWALAHLLETIKDELDFPLLVEHGDRPDFLIKAASRTIGIEHTEAVPENEAHASYLRELGYGPDIYSIPRISINERKKSKAELIAELEADKDHDGWSGDAPEQEWALAMANFTERKVGATQKPGFLRQSENWLLIYDNWPLPAIDPGNSAALLQNHLVCNRAFDAFGSVFVLSDQWLWAFSGSGWSVRPINRF
jgi:hypothetical protein